MKLKDGSIYNGEIDNHKKEGWFMKHFNKRNGNLLLSKWRYFLWRVEQ